MPAKQPVNCFVICDYFRSQHLPWYRGGGAQVVSGKAFCGLHSAGVCNAHACSLPTSIPFNPSLSVHTGFANSALVAIIHCTSVADGSLHSEVHFHPLGLFVFASIPLLPLLSHIYHCHPQQ